jgi:uroporphyrinogen decarboxylase
MTKRERVRATLAGEPADRAPASLWGHDFLREWSPEDLVAATLDAYRGFDWDFIKLNPRATYFAEAWGNTYDRPAEQRQPRLGQAAVRDAADLRGLAPADPRAGVFAEHLRALSMLVDAVAGEADVIHTVFSPLSVAAQLTGSDEAFRTLATDDPGAAQRAIQAVAETLSAYARAAVDAGAAGIFFAPLHWASRDTADEAFYAEFGRPYDLQVLGAVRDAEFNVMHVCRNHNMLETLLDYPVAAFNWADHGEGNPTLEEIRASTRKALMGGIDQARLHTMSPAEARAQADAAIAVGRGIFVTAGCAIRPDTPRENQAAVMQAVRGGRAVR